MARIFAFNIFLFLVPFIAYAAYLLITRGSFRNIAEWQMRTIAYLALGGAALMVASILYFGHIDLQGADRVYVPARFEDGKIVPGELVPKEQAEAPSE